MYVELSNPILISFIHSQKGKNLRKRITKQAQQFIQQQNQRNRKQSRMYAANDRQINNVMMEGI